MNYDIEKEVQELMLFFNYLDRRGFFRDDLCCDIEHQVRTYVEQFKHRDEKQKLKQEHSAS